MLTMLALGPLELVMIAGGALSLYGIYRIGYRIGKAEGALQERERRDHQKSA